jgi:hypothetical protein
MDAYVRQVLGAIDNRDFTPAHPGG